jgi:hypothetical protein
LLRHVHRQTLHQLPHLVLHPRLRFPFRWLQKLVLGFGYHLADWRIVCINNHHFGTDQSFCPSLAGPWRLGHWGYGRRLPRKKVKTKGKLIWRKFSWMVPLIILLAGEKLAATHLGIFLHKGNSLLGFHNNTSNWFLVAEKGVWCSVVEYKQEASWERRRRVDNKAAAYNLHIHNMACNNKARKEHQRSNCHKIHYGRFRSNHTAMCRMPVLVPAQNHIEWGGNYDDDYGYDNDDYDLPMLSHWTSSQKLEPWGIESWSFSW